MPVDESTSTPSRTLQVFKSSSLSLISPSPPLVSPWYIPVGIALTPHVHPPMYQHSGCPPPCCTFRTLFLQSSGHWWELHPLHMSHWEYPPPMYQPPGCPPPCCAQHSTSNGLLFISERQCGQISLNLHIRVRCIRG